MSPSYKKILLATLTALHLIAPIPKFAYAEEPPVKAQQEFGRFKKAGEQHTIMGEELQLKKGFQNWGEVGKGLEIILKNPGRIEENLADLSEFQKGQMIIRALFEFSQLEKRTGDSKADLIYKIITLLYKYNGREDFNKGQTAWVILMNTQTCSQKALS